MMQKAILCQVVQFRKLCHRNHPFTVWCKWKMSLLYHVWKSKFQMIIQILGAMEVAIRIRKIKIILKFMFLTQFKKKLICLKNSRNRKAMVRIYLTSNNQILEIVWIHLKSQKTEVDLQFLSQLKMGSPNTL